jgi:hypothetical protein
MLKTKSRMAGALLTAGLAGVFALVPVARAEDRPASEFSELVAKIDKRVQAWQPTPEERRVDDIAWAKDLRDALRLAKDTGRPVFLFTYSGCTDRDHALALRRC